MLKVAPCTVGHTVVRPNFFGLMGYNYFGLRCARLKRCELRRTPVSPPVGRLETIRVEVCWVSLYQALWKPLASSGWTSLSIPSPFTSYSIFSVAVCIFTTPAGSLKFGKNFKNTRRYYTSETSSDLYTFINTVSCGRPQCSGECRGRRGPRGQRGRTGSKGQPGPKGPRGPPVSTYFARYLALIL